MYDIDKLSRLFLGRVGENEANEIKIDCSKWRAEWPECILFALYVRPTETSPYVPAVSVDEEGVLTWVVDSTDVALAGNGALEIRAIDAENGKLRKTKIIQTLVAQSMTGMDDENAPSWEEAWQNRLAVAEGEAEQAAARADEATTNANEAAEKADTKAAAANRAANTAMQNAAEALAASRSADRASENANEATASANTAATNANDAAIRANASAANAEVATASAETAATRANNAAHAAQTLADAIDATVQAGVETVNTAGTTNLNAVNQAGTSAIAGIQQKAESFTDYAGTQKQLAEVKENIQQLKDYLETGTKYIDVEWENGNLSNGANSDNSKAARLRTVGYLPTKDVTSITVNMSAHDYFLYMNYFDADYKFVSSTPFNQQNITIEMDKSYFRIVLINVDNGSWTNPISVSNGNDVTITGETISTPKDASAYRGLYSNFVNAIDGECFVFFSDPHNLGAVNEYEAEKVLKFRDVISDAYNKTSASFVVSGGDWLNSGDTQAFACEKLGYLTGVMREKFPFYNVVGNHDTNYQGVVSASDPTRGDLTNECMSAIMFRKYGHNYYAFDGDNSRCYVFDTGIDWEWQMTDYRWEQIDWFANSLINDDPQHGIVFMHIAFIDYQTLDVTQKSMLCENIGGIINAYNSKTTVTTNGKTYDFINCTGRVWFALCGHVHADISDTIGGVPLVTTRNVYNNDVISFDVCYADFAYRKLQMFRTGKGQYREFNI